jgi:hypothetical protein
VSALASGKPKLVNVFVHSVQSRRNPCLHFITILYCNLYHFITVHNCNLCRVLLKCRFLIDKTHHLRSTHSKTQIFVQDLALGIADLDTPEALAAPQRATAAQIHEMDVDEDSSQDDSELDSDDNTHKTEIKSR